jgi:hypothetical protein
MRLLKIKETKAEFYDGCGPAAIITLGIQVVDQGESYILGKYYFGPQMNNVHKELFDKTETFIDAIIDIVDLYNQAKEPKKV